MWVSKNKADIQTIFSSLVKKSGQYRFFIIVSVLWYLAFFPGRLGADGSGAIRMLQQGISTKWWTAIYFWFLRITSFDEFTTKQRTIKNSILLFRFPRCVFLQVGLRPCMLVCFALLQF